jgi:putative transposase
MARPLRIEFPDALYHVTSRGNERRAIFRSNHDRRAFLEFLGIAARRFGWSVTAWVLMTNHFHLVVQTPEPNLSRGMQWLNGVYASWFNARHRRSGHLLQGRFKSVLVDSQHYFAEVLRYVVLNPVRAKMVERPEDYRWSSYHVTAGHGAPDWFDLTAALAPFGGSDASAPANYRAYVDAGIASTEQLWDKVICGMYLGSEPWAKKMRAMVESRPRSTDHPRMQRAVGRPGMQRIIAAVAETARISSSMIRATRGGYLRGLAAWLGWNEGLLTLRSIAASLRLRSEGHISNIIRRCEAAFAENAELLMRMDAALASLRA